MEIAICPLCRTQVLPKRDGTCPACQRAIEIARWVPVVESQNSTTVRNEAQRAPAAQADSIVDVSCPTCHKALKVSSAQSGIYCASCGACVVSTPIAGGESMQSLGFSVALPDSILQPADSQIGAKSNRHGKWTQWVIVPLVGVAYLIIRGPLRNSGLSGLIPIIGGIYALLLGIGVVPASADAAQSDECDASMVQ